METPYKGHWEQEIDHHQVGYLDIAVDKNGKGTIHAKFSNGKQWDGDHFYVSVAFVDKAGEAIAAHRLKKGLDGSFGGSAREGDVHSPIQYFKGKSWADVERITYRFGTFDGVDDKAFWEAVKTAIETIIEAGDEKYQEKKQDRGPIKRRPGPDPSI